MKRKAAQKLVSILSVAVLVIAAVWFVVDHALGLRVPITVDVALAYGLFFSITLFFDSIGRQAKRLRSDADGARPRPAPSPASGGRRVAPVPSPGPATSSAEPSDVAESALPSSPVVQLQRVRPDQAPALQKLLDAAVRELLALADRRPQTDADGHVTELTARAWLDNSACYPFFVFLDETCVGCCALERQADELTLCLMYIEPVRRRRHIGALAIDRLAEFARMVTDNQALSLYLPPNNHRGRRFAAACGFHMADEAQSPAPTVIGGSFAGESPQLWMLLLREE